MKKVFLFLIILSCLVLPATATPEKPAIGLKDGSKYPLLDQATQILISHATYPDLTQFKVQVTYRPNSMVTFTKNIGSPDSDGRLSWTPHDAGICVIEAIAPGLKEGDKEIKITNKVSVRYGSFPPMGLLVMLLAACTLFGGLIYSFTKLQDTPT